MRANLRAAGAELHIIGRDQVTTDLPEWRQDKGKPLAEYKGLTRDQRTRGISGLLTSCGEENLLKLEKDRYRGRDICVHEFAHNILGYGMASAVREKVKQQYGRSLGRGLWAGSYAGSNYDEFFAELSMWYFGTHGDVNMKGLKPAVGREGLKAYDPEAFNLLDDFYRGRLEEPVVEAGFSGRSLKEEAGMPGLFKPDWASLKAHQDPEWFRDAKFGIYTHWGPVTLGCEDAPQGGEWYGREMYLTNNPIFAYHKQRFGDQHTFGYKQVIPLFTARKFDPEKWADLFARAGAKFAGPVAVHHDNFAMWASAVTPWNSVKMGPKRDITGELAKAYRARGLKLITTFHHGFAWRYYEPAFQFDAADGRDFQLYTEPHGPKDPPSRRFQEQWLAMVMEVVRQYEPDRIWFDFELNEVITPEYQRRMFADYYNWAAKHGKESAVAHKFGEIRQHTGILDFERGREDRLEPYPWLTDTALGPWFNRKADPYRSTENLIHVLADIVAKNGCLLLNVGPNADGSIPERAEKMLLEMGAWLQVNGEAIYGTRPWLVYGEGPTRNGGGGFSEGKDQAFRAQDIRFTTKGDALYAITLGWPQGAFTLHSVRAESDSASARVELLGHGSVPHRLNAENQIIIEPPALVLAQLPCQYAFSFKLTGFKTSVHPSNRFE